MKSQEDLQADSIVNYLKTLYQPVGKYKDSKSYHQYAVSAISNRCATPNALMVTFQHGFDRISRTKRELVVTARSYSNAFYLPTQAGERQLTFSM